jgi:ribonuclease P protein subunit RPR2
MIEIAKERMDILFSLAQKEYDNKNNSCTNNPQRANERVNESSANERPNRYVELALKISKKYNTSIPLKWKRRYCKSCHKFLQPGINSKIRLSNNQVNIKCLECNHILHIPYKKEQKLKRRAKIESYTIKKRNHE